MSIETLFLARYSLFNETQVATVERVSLLLLLAIQSHKRRLRRCDEPFVFQSLPDCYWQASQGHVAIGSIFKQLNQGVQNDCRHCGSVNALHLSEFLPGHRQ